MVFPIRPVSAAGRGPKRAPTMGRTIYAVVREVFVVTLIPPKSMRTPNRAAPIAIPTMVLVSHLPRSREPMDFFPVLAMIINPLSYICGFSISLPHRTAPIYGPDDDKAKVF